MDIQKEVSRFVDISNEEPAPGMNELVHRLVTNGLTETEAEALVAFVPMAFAHEVLSAAGVTLPDTFLVRDSETGANVRGILKDDPVFIAARALARLMFNDPAKRERANRVAAQSAECAVVLDLCPDGENVDGCVLTETVLGRLPATYLTKPKEGGKWRFWRFGKGG